MIRLALAVLLTTIVLAFALTNHDGVALALLILAGAPLLVSTLRSLADLRAIAHHNAALAHYDRACAAYLARHRNAPATPSLDLSAALDATWRQERGAGRDSYRDSDTAALSYHNPPSIINARRSRVLILRSRDLN